MSLEQLFATSALSLSVPNASVEFPPSDPSDTWLETLASNSQERKLAFFDEQLQSLLTLRVDHPTPDEPADPLHPPAALITFLAHVQVSLEASYISSVPTSAEAPPITRLSLPPRTASLGGLRSSPRAGGPHHPSILPPHTPNPTPATADHDRKYIASQGTLLFNSIWGQDTADDSQEEFSLIWSEQESVWVAVYRLALTVSFLRLGFADPLLCLTISATLREKPVTASSIQHPLIRFLKTLDDAIVPESPTVADKVQAQVEDDTLDGFEEVNLLEGLLAGPTFSKMASDINLPSTRLGIVSRRKLFALPPVNLPSPAVPSPSPISATRKAQSTLRKSFRKTLETVSGFRVRMRTVFVPSIVLDASQEERDKMAAGGEERTVVLCVEIENSGESGRGIGFEVEKVDVAISGDEAKATLITWGQESFTSQENIFPLKIAQWAQYNLLYAVTFLRSPEELDAFSFSRKTTNTTQTDLQRAVSINIHGKPYVKSPDSTTVIYPTRTFSSKWNCVLDLAPHQPQNLRNLDPADPSTAYPSVLPEPPSPFPVFGLQSSKQSPGFNVPSSAPTASTHDAAKGGQLVAGRMLKSSIPRISAAPMSANPSRVSLPAQVAANTYTRSPTTYSAPPPPPPPHQQSQPDSHQYHSHSLPPSRTHTPPSFEHSPVTPAYPAFPPKSTVPPTPVSHAPVVSQTGGGVVGPSLEARRGRVSGIMGGSEPPTPVPHQHHDVGHGQFGNEQKLVTGMMDGGSGDTVVISVGLLNVIKSGGVGLRKRRKVLLSEDKEASDDDNDDDDDDGEEDEDEDTNEDTDEDADADADADEKSNEGHNEPELGPGKIYPLDSFTLDIFVFNKSERTRRFEISCLERRRRRKGADTVDINTGLDGGVVGATRKMGYPGIMPMESQVRIGPLLPLACQSVRMEFLAVSPGVHTIEALTLTDIESGYSVNLRSVMDVVVHKPDD